MKETIVKNNKSSFFEKIKKNWQTFGQIHQEKERRIKSTKSEMKKERLQQTTHKYKRLEETIMNNSMAIK